MCDAGFSVGEKHQYPYGKAAYGRRWEFKLRDIAPSLVPLADYPMLCRDADGGLIVTVEPYAEERDDTHHALEAWARKCGWRGV